ncbi:MAG: phosphopyruvate hydratase [Opitutaceae bacterium]
MSAITEVKGRMVLDSRGRPTVEVDVILDDGTLGRAIVPSGASTGSREALELRDGGGVFDGQGVDRAVTHVETELADAVMGLDPEDQARVDARLCRADGSPDKSRLGANAILGVSMAACVAASRSRGIPLFEHIASLASTSGDILPRPEIQIIGGGAHAPGSLDIQDLMVVAPHARDFRECLEITDRVFRETGRRLKAKGKFCGCADEGGYWPAFASCEEALEFLAVSVASAGLKLGHDVVLSLDIAATELRTEDGGYHFASEGTTLDPAAWRQRLNRWIEAYGVRMLEDPFGEDDWESWAQLTREQGGRTIVIGDDLFTTNAASIRKGILAGAGNAVLIKLNQIGTVSETLDAITLTRGAGWEPVVSARSGETEDVFIAHLAVGTNAGWLKVGSIQRSERTAKWNEVLRIAETLGDRARRAPYSFDCAR